MVRRAVSSEAKKAKREETTWSEPPEDKERGDPTNAVEADQDAGDDEDESEDKTEVESYEERAMRYHKRKVHEWNREHENQNTRRTYDSALKQFDAWCERYKFTSRMVDETCVARYLQWMVDVKGVAKSTIGVALTAIKDRYKYESTDIADSALVKETVKIANTMTKKKNPKRPLTLTMMHSIVGQWAAKPSHSFTDTRNVFLILLMMAAFLRESETIALRTEDVGVETMEVDGAQREVLLVKVRKAKNDQAGVGHVIMLGASVNDSQLCVIRWFERYCRMRARQGTKSEFLFATHDDKQLSKTTPSSLLKKAVESIGMDPTMYGSHSARIGGTTEASKSGVSTLLLKNHGRWKSDVVYDYIRQTTEQQLSVTEFLYSV